MADRSSMRYRPWYAIVAEGVMIIASILLAFGIDAWWDDRNDRSREQWYLGMLAADLRQTLNGLEAYGDHADDFDRAGARLVRAYHEPDIPPEDSLRSWISMALGWRVVEPTLGTAQTLVATGDLNLLRGDSIRVAVTQYLPTMTMLDRFQQQSADAWRETMDQLVDVLGQDLALLRLSQTSPTRRAALAEADALYPFPAGRIRELPAPDLEALVRSEEVYQLLSRMNEAKTFMRQWRASMRGESEHLLELVEAELETAR